MTNIEFVSIDNKHDNCPIVLIDNSASTSAGGMWNDSKKHKGKYMNILDKELEIAQELFIQRNIEECYLMFWNSNYSFPFGTEKINMSNITICNEKPCGSTNLEVGLEQIPNSWYEGKESVNIYIFTDGELNSGNPRTMLRKYINMGFKIHIITVEYRNANYLTSDCQAGNEIYQVINSECLMNSVREFISFNRFHKTGFVSIDNPDKIPGYFSFQGKYFPVEQIPLFINYLDTLVSDWKSEEVSIKQNINDLKIKYRQITNKQQFEEDNTLNTNDTDTSIFSVISKTLEKAFSNTNDNKTTPSLEDVLNNYDSEETALNDISNNIETLKNKLKTLDTKLLKLVHEVSFTVHQMIDSKPYNIKRGIINTICQIFVETDIYRQVRSILLEESDNIKAGKTNTFQAYRRNREKVFEKSQRDLYQNVLNNISATDANTCVSFPFHNVLYTVETNDANKTVNLNKNHYQYAGFELDKYTYPILPLNITPDDGNIDQCLRQWIRTNYAKVYNVNVASDVILYYFLTDALCVQLSDANDTVKKAYKDMSRVMLDRKRFGTSNKEYHYLLDNNPPAPVVGEQQEILVILSQCLEKIGIKSDDLSPMTLWYGIVLMMNDELLVMSQKRFCKEALEKDSLYNVTNDSVMEYLKTKLPNINQCNLQKSVNFNYEYQCYLTLDDTSNTGGYYIPAHYVSRHVKCAPTYVMAPSIMEDDNFKSNNTMKCPLCYSNIEINKLIWIDNQETMIKKDKESKEELSIPVLDIPVYDNTLHQVVEISESIYKNDDNLKLKPMSDCNFNVTSFEINCPMVNDSIGNRHIELKTQEEFNEHVEKRYPFLKEIDMKSVNMCLAGGFCRSILLKQRLKDLDFFFYGDLNDEQYMINFRQALNNTLQALNKHYDGMGVKFLIMYKPLFNVFEIVCVKDPTNFLKEDYNLDNFKQYDFKSLHRYDKYTIIDPDSGKLYRKKNKYSHPNEDTKMENIENKDFSNYFEDGDINGIRMVLRVQFILTKYKRIENILHGFDMYPCQVAYDGHITHFTEKSEMAYKYMINVINENNYSELFDYRLSKYFIYGFSIVLPELDISKVRVNRELQISGLRFMVTYIQDNMITVEKNSQIKKQLDSLQSVEQKNAKKGKALYKSVLFCSLISLLRYVKINEINYIFSDKIMLPDADGTMKFMESTAKVHFIDKLDTRKSGEDIYRHFRIEHNSQFGHSTYATGVSSAKKIMTKTTPKYDSDDSDYEIL